MDSRGLVYLIGSFALISLSECCWGGSSKRPSPTTEAPLVKEARVKVNEELNQSRNDPDLWEDQIGLVSNIYNILEDLVGENFTIPPGNHIRVELESIDLTIASVGVKNFAEQGYNFTNSKDDIKSNSSEPKASVQIPIGGIVSSNDTVAEVLVITSVTRQQNESEERDAVIDEGEYLYNVASSIVTVRLLRNGAGHGYLPDITGVTVTIPYENTTKDPESFYFKEENVNISNGRGLQWSTAGCNSKCDETERICEMNCNHATSFAVLQILGESKLSHRGKVASSILTTIGCLISITSLITALIIYFVLRSRIATEQYVIHANLMVALLISLCIFMTLSIERKSEVLCKFKQFLLQYFFSAAFCWMLCEGIHLYRKIIAVFESGVKFLLLYFFIGWVLPLSFVLVAIINSTSQEMEKRQPFRERDSKPCFFSHEDGSIWYFLVPVLVVIVINSGILVRVNFIVVKAAKLQAGKDSSQAMYQAKAGLRSGLLLIPLLGCSYILGFLASLHGAFEIMYNIINSLQGFFVALFYCLMNKEIRAAIGKYIQRAQDMSTIQTSTTQSTAVNLPLRKLFEHNKVGPGKESIEEPAVQPLKQHVKDPVEKPPQKSARRSVETPAEKIAREPPTKPDKERPEKPDKEPLEKRPRKSVKLPSIKPAGKPTKESQTQPGRQRLEKPDTQPLKKLEKVPQIKPGKLQAQNPTKEPPKKPKKEVMEKSAKDLIEKPAEYCIDQ